MKKILVFLLFIFLALSLSATTYNTITINGVNSGWVSDEDFTDCSSADLAYLTWDETYFYFAIADAEADYGNLTTFMYFDTDPDGSDGSTDAYAWGNNITTPFKSDFVVVWRNSADYIEFMTWNGSSWDQTSWVDGSALNTDEVKFAIGTDYREVCVKRSILGVSSSSDKIGFCSFTEQQWGSYWRYFTFPSEGWTDAVRGAGQSIGHYRGYLLGSGYSPDDAGSYDHTLPVELSTFTAQYLAGKPLLYWTTQSETDNMGWFVYRNEVEDFTSATKVSGMIEGHGTTTQAQSYVYEDVIANPQVDDVYYYWLESVDYSGTIHHFDKVAMITIPETNDPNPNVTPPQVYDLLASPNPFNETTNIEFMLTQTAFVDVAIYDVKGALVKSFDTQHVTADDKVSLQWDGKDENGKSLSNGIYLYSLKVNGQDYATKQVILMK